jgi:hypothetical protein
MSQTTIVVKGELTVRSDNISFAKIISTEEARAIERKRKADALEQEQPKPSQ